MFKKFMYSIALIAFLIGMSSPLLAQDPNADKRKVARIATNEMAQTNMTEVSPEAVAADLKKSNPKAAKQFMVWMNAKHFRINKSGNFVPFKPPKNSAKGNSNANQNLAEGGTNCAQIKCPPVFDPDVVCWKCM